MNIVVIGYGWVGQANALALTLMGEKVSFFDPQESKYHYEKKYGETYKKVRRLNNALELDALDTTYIVSVGDKVLPDGEQDISAIKAALNSLKDAKGIVVLRSTILPMTLKDLKFDFYVPEFLHEKKAVEECGRPHFFVVGKKTDRPEPALFKTWQKNAYKIFRGTPEEASYIKYLSNVWNSMRIAFVNEFGDAMKTPKTPDDVKSIERVVDFVFGGKFYLRYGKAYGGHCLPKDTLAFTTAHKKQGKEMAMVAGGHRANDLHAAIHQEHNLIPEWFSEWQTQEISGRVALTALIKAGQRLIVRKVFSPIRAYYKQIFSSQT